MTPEYLQSLAKQTAGGSGLDPAILCAIAEQESGWNPWAIRFEMAWALKLHSDPSPLGLHISPPTKETEIAMRAMSWGLCQVLGQTAREYGFSGAYLTALCDPQTGLDIGARVLVGKLRLAQGDVRQALLYWNGGGNASYPTEVLARMEKYR